MPEIKMLYQVYELYYTKRQRGFRDQLTGQTKWIDKEVIERETWRYENLEEAKGQFETVKEALESRLKLGTIYCPKVELQQVLVIDKL